MQISSIDIILSPKKHLPQGSDKLRLAASKSVEVLNDKLGTWYNQTNDVKPIFSYVSPIRWLDHRDGNYNPDAPQMTGEYAFGIELKRTVALTPTFAKMYLDFLLETIGTNFELNTTIQSSGKVTSHGLIIPPWSFFPSDVVIYQNPQDTPHSHVDASIKLEGMALNDGQKEILRGIAEDVRFPDYKHDFDVSDSNASGFIPTWLNSEGSGVLKRYNPRYGDQHPSIVLRRKFDGELSGEIEGMIESWYNQVRDVSIQAGIPTAYLTLQLAQLRRQWLQEKGMDLAKEVASASAFNNGLYGPQLSIEYHMEKPDGRMVLQPF